MRNSLFAAACFVVAGCGGLATRSTSTVSGSLLRDTFPNDPRSVTATDERGATITTVPNGDGAFKLVLPKGHRYRLAVVSADGSVPIVFPRNSGELDQWFRVSGGAAIVNLGSVRHLAAAPTTGFKMQALIAPADDANASQGGGECEDGVDVATGGACIDDHGQMSCEANDEEEEDDDVDGNFEGDGQCENGTDATTGGACTTASAVESEAEEAASAESPMAIAEHNVPDEVGGCDESDDDDEEEEEGEHED
jgi:hypothetical protein